MKKALAVIVAVFIAISSMTVSSAKETVNFYFETDSVLKDRLFEINVCVDKKSIVCGGEAVISFDSDIAQFRCVSGDNYYVEAVENSDGVHVVYSAIYPVDSNECFTLQFKSISEGSFDIGYRNIQCIDGNLKIVSVNSSDSQVTVKSKSVAIKSKKSTKSKSSTIKDEKKALHSEIFSNDSEYAELSDGVNVETYNSKSDKVVTYVVAGVCAFWVVVWLMFCFVRKTQSENKILFEENKDKVDT